MCDYSLHHVASRPAKVGDKLITTHFENSVTCGFAAVEERSVAVCLLPGTELVFDDKVERDTPCDMQYAAHQAAYSKTMPAAM